jgi:hypothetical protein
VHCPELLEVIEALREGVILFFLQFVAPGVIAISVQKVAANSKG